jgi:site-specific DNA-methyltransferase (adenine-specific)
MENTERKYRLRNEQDSMKLEECHTKEFLRRAKMLEHNCIYHGDCLELLNKVEDKSIELILTDPPYNIGKADWDKWPTPADYVNFMGKVFVECQRVLKDNGTMYFFHNDIPQISMLMEWIRENTKFIFNSFCIWNKGDFRALAWKNPSDKNNLRSWFTTCEYCLVYTLQDDYGLNHFLMQRNLLKPVQEYLLNERRKTGLSNDDIRKLLNQNTVHYFSLKASHWRMPSESNYKILQSTGFFQKPYSELLSEYEMLKSKHEELRYIHNLDIEHNNLWTSTEKPNDGKLHPTQKPVDLLEKIIKCSSNEGDTVLDMFMGVASTGVAARELNRRFIGIEIDDEYYEACEKRIKETEEKMKSFR